MPLWAYFPLRNKDTGLCDLQDPFQLAILCSEKLPGIDAGLLCSRVSTGKSRVSSDSPGF